MIIAFMGKAGSGKDTAAEILHTLIPTRTYAFADRLKEIAKSLGWDGEKDEKGRKFLQSLGQCVREYNENTWADIVIDQIVDFDLVALPCVYVITDLRFPNEIKRLKEKFKKVVVVKLVGRQEELGDLSEDISEHALDNYVPDYTIINSSSKEYLKFELKQILAQELK